MNMHMTLAVSALRFGICTGGQAQEQRDAQTALATMDHADIRGLVTALHLSVAGLPAL